MRVDSVIAVNSLEKYVRLLGEMANWEGKVSVWTKVLKDHMFLTDVISTVITTLKY